MSRESWSGSPLADKTCAICGQTFQAKHPAARYCSNRCRNLSSGTQASREYYQAYYQKNKDKIKASSSARMKLRQAAHREAMAAYKLEVGCVDCGYNAHPAALDFDHVDGVKSFSISRMGGMKPEKLAAELEKCVVRCANCHRIRHHEMRAGGDEPPPADD